MSHLPHSPGIPVTPRQIERAIADINRDRAQLRLPLLDPAEFLRRAGEAAVGVGGTAALIVATVAWLVTP
jgi:hypothetical protein